MRIRVDGVRAKYINFKLYTSTSLESEQPLPATVSQAKELCDGLGLAYSDSYAFFTPQGECLLTIVCDKLTRVCKIGNRRVERSCLKSLLNNLFGYQLHQ